MIGLAIKLFLKERKTIVSFGDSMSQPEKPLMIESINIAGASFNKFCKKLALKVFRRLEVEIGVLDTRQIQSL